VNKRTLGNLLKIRRASVNDARAVLAGALMAEDAAAADEAAVGSMVEAEVKAASDASADDTAVEALAAWLPQARTRQDVVHDRHRQAEAATSRARAALAAARTAEALVENLIVMHETDEGITAEQQTQATLREYVATRPEHSAEK
jgi:hypothetical protein